MRLAPPVVVNTGCGREPPVVVEVWRGMWGAGRGAEGGWKPPVRAGVVLRVRVEGLCCGWDCGAGSVGRVEVPREGGGGTSEQDVGLSEGEGGWLGGSPPWGNG